MTRFQLNDAGFRSLGDFVNDMLNEVPRTVNALFPRTNIFETSDDYQIEILAPGRRKEDFKISLDKKMLTISYEAPQNEKKEEDRKVIKSEFSLRPFSRSFTVDEKIDIEGIGAKYENGVLILSLPKKEEVKVMPKEIAVQ